MRLVADGDGGDHGQVEAALLKGTRAVVRVDSPSGRVEVSIANSVTRGVALREVLQGAPTLEAEPVLAVRAVEFVRAMLLGAPTAPRAPRRPPDAARGDRTGSPGDSTDIRELDDLSHG